MERKEISYAEVIRRRYVSNGEISHTTVCMQFTTHMHKFTRGHRCSLQITRLKCGSVPMTTELGTNGAATLSRMTFSGYLRHVALVEYSLVHAVW